MHSKRQANTRTRSVAQGDVAAPKHVSHEELRAHGCALERQRLHSNLQPQAISREGQRALEHARDCTSPYSALVIALFILERASSSHSGSCPAPAREIQ